MEIKGDGLVCRLQFSTPDQEGWMGMKVDVEVPGFGGTYTCDVEIKEFEQFVLLFKQLENAIGSECEASWGNMEGNIALKFHLDRRGGLRCQYQFSPDSLGPHLSGEFSADQTYIRNWLGQAERVLREVSATRVS